jgi:glycosyltransferase involved in cell wall biosynthesis
MISVLIPYLAYMPYKEQIKRTISDLERQTADLEIIVSEQEIKEKHTRICKGRLHNEGFAKAKGDIIFHCDADIIIEDETLLERMENKLREGFDVIYPMFWSVWHEMNKLADGHPFMTREVLEEYGPLNEDDMGISLVSFRLLHWLYYNKKFHASDEFLIALNTEPFTKHKNKSDKATRLECRPIAVEVINDLKGDGLWPGVKKSV